MMKISQLATALVTIVVITMPLSGWSADGASDPALVQAQTAVIPKLQESAAQAGGYTAANVRVSTDPHQITISVLDKKAKHETAAVRERRAEQMVARVEEEITSQKAFSEVMAIHVNYVEKRGKSAPIIQSIDFFKSPTGGFVAHKS